MIATRLHVSAALLTISALAMAAPAAADPVHTGTAATASCSDGNNYDAVIAGNGRYLPAHLTTSTQVFKPVAYGEFTTTITDAEGAVVYVEVAPAIGQGGGNVLAHNPKSYLDCTVALSASLEGGYTVTVTGTTTGFLTPASGGVHDSEAVHSAASGPTS